jgi:Zinc knuckle
VLRYIPVRTGSLWKTIEAWADQTKTYKDFKVEVFKFYPGSSGNRTYSLQDLDALTGCHARTGIATAAELGEYYREFLLISCYLVSKICIATQEQSRAFFRGLPSHLEALVCQHLQAKFIDHFPDDLYLLSNIYNATSYVLTCGMSAVSALHPSTLNQPISTADPMSTKLEALTTAIASLGQLFQSALLPQFTGVPSSSVATTASVPSTLPSSICRFCGEPGHYIRECDAVTEYIKAGKCQHSPEGRVALPSAKVQKVGKENTRPYKACPAMRPRYGGCLGLIGSYFVRYYLAQQGVP